MQSDNYWNGVEGGHIVEIGEARLLVFEEKKNRLFKRERERERERESERVQSDSRFERRK